MGIHLSKKAINLKNKETVQKYVECLIPHSRQEKARK